MTPTVIVVGSTDASGFVASARAFAEGLASAAAAVRRLAVPPTPAKVVTCWRIVNGRAVRVPK